MKKQIITTFLTLFCCSMINSDSVARDIFLQERDFPGVNLHELTQLIALKEQQDMPIPAEEGYTAGYQTTRIMDEFHAKIYERVKDQHVLNIGIGLGFSDALMLLTPMTQLDAVEMSKPACLAAFKFIKSFQHLWPRTDISYRENKRFNLLNKDISNADFALPSMKYDTIICLNVSHLMKPSQFSAMLVKILTSLKDDQSRLFLRVGMPTLPPSFRNAYKQGKANGLQYPGCLYSENKVKIKKGVLDPNLAIKSEDTQSVEETHEYFNPGHIITNKTKTKDTITITERVSTFVISSNEMYEMLDNTGYEVIEMYTDTPDQGRLEGRLITWELLEKYFEDGLALDVIAKPKATLTATST